MTKECPIHDKLKQALLNASELDTMLIMRSIGAIHRVGTMLPLKNAPKLNKTTVALMRFYLL